VKLFCALIFSSTLCFGSLQTGVLIEQVKDEGVRKALQAIYLDLLTPPGERPTAEVSTQGQSCAGSVCEALLQFERKFREKDQGRLLELVAEFLKTPGVSKDDKANLGSLIWDIVALQVILPDRAASIAWARYHGLCQNFRTGSFVKTMLQAAGIVDAELAERIANRLQKLYS
jgi:hypothetical protein